MSPILIWSEWNVPPVGLVFIVSARSRAVSSQLCLHETIDYLVSNCFMNIKMKTSWLMLKPASPMPNTQLRSSLVGFCDSIYQNIITFLLLVDVCFLVTLLIWVEFIGVLRHMQRYFSHICDGTDLQADLRRSSCTYGRVPNAIDILQDSLTCQSYIDSGPPFLQGDSDTPPNLVALGLTFVLMLRPFFPELVMSTDLLSFEHPSVLLFCLLRHAWDTEDVFQTLSPRRPHEGPVTL